MARWEQYHPASSTHIQAASRVSPACQVAGALPPPACGVPWPWDVRSNHDCQENSDIRCSACYNTDIYGRYRPPQNSDDSCGTLSAYWKQVWTPITLPIGVEPPTTANRCGRKTTSRLRSHNCQQVWTPHNTVSRCRSPQLPTGVDLWHSLWW